MIEKVTLTDKDKVMVFSTESKNIYLEAREYSKETNEVTKPIIANLKDRGIRVERPK